MDCGSVYNEMQSIKTKKKPNAVLKNVFLLHYIINFAIVFTTFNIWLEISLGNTRTEYPSENPSNTLLFFGYTCIWLCTYQIITHCVGQKFFDDFIPGNYTNYSQED
jgi:hypothetical protein